MQTISYSTVAAAKAVISRLLTVRQLWEDAADAYFDPPRFQSAVQQCITTSRTVTFILQANKHAIVGFEEWYGGFTAAWAKDRIMVWAKTARNTIEKRGDFDTHSQVRATIIASYMDGPVTEWIPQSLFASTTQIFRSMPQRFLIPHVIEHGTLLIERRWIDNEFPHLEILEALAHVYDNFCEMTISLLTRLGLKVPPSIAHGRPSAWGDARAMDRAVYLSMKDASTRGYRYLRSELQLSSQDQKRITKGYQIGNQVRQLQEAKTFRDVALIFFQRARVAMLRDGYHMSLCVALRGNSVIELIDFAHPDRASRYIIMRDLAKLLRIMGADGVILISEVWTASQENIPKSGFAVDAPNRGEGLILNAVNAKAKQHRCLLRSKGDDTARRSSHCPKWLKKRMMIAHFCCTHS
jgi:hypothetical protein